ncbi:MAG: hypothetical protein GWP14_08555 [Actinobacteria bacterium]|nr:hypothetical protein [Actinomycetota bacterium]
MIRSFSNPFELPGKWYKANLHTHTTTSDGQFSVTERVRQYREGGYGVLAITDHVQINDVRGLSDKKLLVISGAEFQAICPKTTTQYHIVALNLNHGFKFDSLNDVGHCISQVKKAGGESILAHPYWSSLAGEDFRHLKGLAAVEIYNSTCDMTGRPNSENEWAYCLDHGQILPMVGNDDAHFDEGEDTMACWTWFKMPSLNVKNLLRALRSGGCYVSCGPKVHDFRITRGKIRLRCTAAVKIYFVGGPGQGDRRRAKESKSINTFSVAVPDWPYVRAVIVDERGRKAWTQPIILNKNAAL